MGRTDTAIRVISASPDRAFVALTDSDALAVWLPPDGMTGRFEHFDARPGGSYRLVLTYADASAARGKSAVDSDVVDGMGGHPVDARHASTSGPTMYPTGSTLQITRRDCRPRWTISPLTLNAERRLSSQPQCSSLRRTSVS